MPKRKLDQTGDHATQRPSVPTGILHVSSISDHGPFTAFSRVKGTASKKLEHLQNIRNQRLDMESALEALERFLRIGTALRELHLDFLDYDKLPTSTVTFYRAIKVSVR